MILQTDYVNEVLEENKNLVYSICSKYASYADIEDLYQVGMIGLMKALEKYDRAKDTKFSTYAFTYIVGEVSSYARSNRNIKVSRDLIRLGKKLNEYIDKYQIVRGYKPSINEMSKTFDLKESKIIDALNASLCEKSLDESINDDGKIITLLDKMPYKESIGSDELIDLKEAFNELNASEKKLIVDRYFNDLTQNDVAKNMGVNQVYVSRLEKKALTKMKNKMTNI